MITFGTLDMIHFSSGDKSSWHQFLRLFLFHIMLFHVMGYQTCPSGPESAALNLTFVLKDENENFFTKFLKYFLPFLDKNFPSYIFFDFCIFLGDFLISWLFLAFLVILFSFFLDLSWTFFLFFLIFSIES